MMEPMCADTCGHDHVYVCIHVCRPNVPDTQDTERFFKFCFINSS